MARALDGGKVVWPTTSSTTVAPGSDVAARTAFDAYRSASATTLWMSTFYDPDDVDNWRFTNSGGASALLTMETSGLNMCGPSNLSTWRPVMLPPSGANYFTATFYVWPNTNTFVGCTDRSPSAYASNRFLGLQTLSSGAINILTPEAKAATVSQSQWNIDPLDGTGPSRMVLSSVTTNQAATGVPYPDGTRMYTMVVCWEPHRYRIGFVINWVVVWAHEVSVGRGNQTDVSCISRAIIPIARAIDSSAHVGLHSMCVFNEGGDVSSAPELMRFVRGYVSGVATGGATGGITTGTSGTYLVIGALSYDTTVFSGLPVTAPVVRPRMVTVCNYGANPVIIRIVRNVASIDGVTAAQWLTSGSAGTPAGALVGPAVRAGPFNAQTAALARVPVDATHVYSFVTPSGTSTPVTTAIRTSFVPTINTVDMEIWDGFADMCATYRDGAMVYESFVVMATTKTGDVTAGTVYVSISWQELW